MVDRKPPQEPEGGFLDRWSRRKVDARQGVPLAEPAPSEPQPGPAPPQTKGATADDAAAPAKDAPLPTLADVQALTAESDFAPFMARGVAPGVRNAAMKKLFTDPHYNVMDGLDIYIDDYTKTTPLTLAMIKSMASAKFLGLLDDEAEEAVDDSAAQAAASPDANAAAPQHREDADAPDELRVADSSDTRDPASDEPDDSDRPERADRPDQALPPTSES